MRQPLTATRYTLQFKNGRLLRHQSPLALAQFRADIRLASYWPEADRQQASSAASQSLN